LKLNNIDRLYVFNGRYAPQRGVFRACQKNKIKCYLIERGSTLNHYTLFLDKLPHDIENTSALINNLWAKASDMKKRNEQASAFFLNKIRNISPTWIAYTKDQKKGLLPQKWDGEKENIVIFLSSEDEFVAIGDMWQNKFYNTQTEGIKKIVTALEDDHNIHIYLRVHPNLINVNNKQTKELKLLNFQNLTVIAADSPVSTYALIRNASKVVTFGSSVGVEATYWDIPSILAGPSFYQNLQCTYNPNDHEELIKLIRSKLTPKNKEGALKYGYYFQTFGIPFKYYKAKAIKKGALKNVELNKSRLLLGLYVVLKILFPLGKLLTYLDILRLKRKILLNRKY
jgi:capsule polysaccharide export protein KpsC/LpsZ